MRHEVHRSSTLEYLTLYPDGYQQSATSSLLVWLHGFGANMYDLAPVAGAISLSSCLHLLPNAPLGGFDGPEGTVRAWFERGGKEKPESVRLALAALDVFVQEVLVKFSVPAGQALLLGFSQGGNLALRYALPRPELFAGVAALSCSLRRPDDLRANLPVTRSQSIFMAHGVEDEMIDVECSRQVVAFLAEQGYRPIYQEYPMGHEITEAVVADLTGWISKTLSPEHSGRVG
jgi:phospholipase/carboxylesterase